MGTHTRTDAREFLDYLDGVCRYSGHTLRAYETGLAQYEQFLRRRRCTARTATIEDVIAYAKSLRDRARSTAALRMSAVRGLHRYMHAMGYVQRDVAALVPSPRRDRGRRPAPTVDLVIAARDTLTSSRDRAIFGLLYGSALRISEVRSAYLMDVQLTTHGDEGWITVCGKGRKWRTVELDEFTVRALREWIEVDRGLRRNDYLFPGHLPGKHTMGGCRVPISETPIRRMLDRAAHAVGLERLTPHMLRRARGRVLKKAGADPFDVRDIYGHDTLSQTADYVCDDTPTLPDVVRERVRELEQQRHPRRLPGVGRAAPTSRPTSAHASAGRSVPA